MQLKLELKRKVGRPRIHKVKPKSNGKGGPPPVYPGHPYEKELKILRQKIQSLSNEKRGNKIFL